MTLREFAPESIQRDTPMSPEYRRVLIRLIASHARGELEAAYTYASWIRRAPGPAEKMYVAGIAHEETEHWYKCIQLMADLVVTGRQIKEFEGSNYFYSIVHLLIPRYTWLDVLMLAFLIDRGAFFMIEDYAHSSYAPWARMAQDILSDEEGHANFGMNCLRRTIEERGKPVVQSAVKKWWRVALNVFGPPRTRYTDTYLRLGLRMRTNEERRLAYRRDAEPQILALGLQVPQLYRETYPFL